MWIGEHETVLASPSHRRACGRDEVNGLKVSITTVWLQLATKATTLDNCCRDKVVEVGGSR
jgi:hypothetical protein